MRLHTLIVIVLSIVGIAKAEEAGERQFREKVRPILERACVSCHQTGREPGGRLALDRLDAVMQGGESGAPIVPGKPADSFLLDMIVGADPMMPKGRAPLKAEEIAAIREWIAAGARWPEGLKLEDKSRPTQDWWSLRPITRPSLPKVSADLERWATTPIDQFVAAKLADKSLRPSPEADRRTLIRRLTYDLHGMPPTMEEIEQFVADENPKEYERLVDRLLASPRYGERFARHWLDAVHYGDTHGYDKDKLRNNAYHYRDYVIRSFNDDKPFDRFVREQIAGDFLYPGTPDAVIATGMLVAGPWDLIGHMEVPESKTDGKIARSLDRDDMIATVMNTFASTTVQCARCHDHKFDPIVQEDYYSMQAIVAAIDRSDRPIDGSVEAKEYKAGERRPALTFAAATHFPKRGTFSATEGKPREIRVLARGDVRSPTKLVGPGVFPAGDLETRFSISEGASEGARRAALAEWIVHRDQPLVWRSIVNRVWMWHFGRGIVDSPNDFGRMGQSPTHPEMLDWLAVEFRDGGMSLKKLHRMIVLSSTYRQSSAHQASSAAIDAGNQYYWRMNRRRLDAESIRDAALAVSGKLDLKMYGPGFQSFVLEKPQHSPHYEYHLHDPDDPKTHRRSIYRFIVRSQPDPWMTTLDCADPSTITDKRDETLTSLQALSLLNNPFMTRMASHAADRFTKSGETSTDAVTAIFFAAIGREPASEELIALEQHADRFGLASAVRVIFNLNEFVFVD